MPDPSMEEQVSLYVLDLLSADQKQEFERRHQHEPEVREMIRDMRVNLEGLALAVPPMQAPPSTWWKILDSVQERKHESPVQVAYRWVKLGLPLAACLALGWLIAYFTIPSAYRLRPRLPVETMPGSEDAGRWSQTAPNDKNINALTNRTGAQRMQSVMAAHKREIDRLDEAINKEHAINQVLAGRVLELGRNTAQLENRIHAYSQGQPGLKRLTVANLSDPRTRTGALSFADEASQVLANDALNRLVGNSAQDNNTTTSSSNSNARSDNIAGTNANRQNPNSSLNDSLSANTAFANSSTTMTNVVPINQLSAPTIAADANPYNIVAPANSLDLSGLANQNTNRTAAVSGTSGTANNSALTASAAGNNVGSTLGVAIYDQIAQSGSLVIHGLPILTLNQTYQFWAVDPQLPQPVCIGFLPALSNGSGQVNFDLQYPNLIPTRFILTLEPAGGSSIPTGPIILEGPNP